VGARTDTVVAMAEASFLDRIVQSLVGKIFIAALQTVLASLALLLAFIARGIADPLLLKYTTLIAVGLLAGYSARRFLKGHTQALQTLTALAAASLSLALLNLLSSGFLGFAPFSGGSSPDWGGLFHYSISALGSLLVIFAFRPRPQAEELPAPAPPVQSSFLQIVDEAKPSLPKLQRPASKKASRGIARVAGKEKASLSSSGVTVQKAARTRTKPPAKKTGPAVLSLTAPPVQEVNKPPRARKKKAHPEIKFIGEEEHICPYCLDPVLEHDPRGVKICPICKTRHHADCWGITGACQIPHAHEKS
jgi:hypothetical protein